jgi:hypothetical protein
MQSLIVQIDIVMPGSIDGIELGSTLMTPTEL